MSVARPLLPTSVVGSHGLPGWVWLAREALEAGRLGRHRLARADRGRHAGRAARPGARRRRRAHHRRDGARALHHRLLRHLHGLRALPAPRRLGQPHWDTNTPFQVVERSDRAGRARASSRSSSSRARSPTRPLKATVPGPYTLMFPLRPGGPTATATPCSPTWSASSTRSAARWSRRAPTSSRSTSRTAACTRARRPTSPSGSTARWRACGPRSPCTSASATSTGGRSSRCASYRNVFPAILELARRRRSSSSSPTGAWTTSTAVERLADRQGARRGRHRREGVPRRDRRRGRGAHPRDPPPRPGRASSGSIPTAASGRRRAGPPASSSPPSSRAPASSARSSEGVSRRGGGSGGPPRCPWPRWRGGRSRRRRPARPRGRS